MLNTVYRLVAPRRFEVAFNDIDLNSDKVVVRPTHLSICHADQRYYQGTRPADVMAKKLPMALIHEAIGDVVYDATGEFKPGELVVMIPNTPVEKDDVIAENYLRSSKFRASGFDGFMQDNVALDRDRLVRLPQDIDRTVAAFTEIVSVSVHALRRFERFTHARKNVVGIWGDGNLGYITAVFFHYMHPDTKLVIFGTNEDKLSGFTFADETHLVWEIPEDLKVDHAIECVGGDASQKAIDQMIDIIQPEGTIALLGVSEYAVPINTRMVLEKGLHLYGSSRSGRADFEKTVELYQEYPEILGYLSNIVGAQVEVNSIADMTRAFEMDINKMKNLDMTYIDSYLAEFPSLIGNGPFLITYSEMLNQYVEKHNWKKPAEDVISETVLKRNLQEYEEMYRSRNLKNLRLVYEKNPDRFDYFAPDHLLELEMRFYHLEHPATMREKIFYQYNRVKRAFRRIVKR